MRVYLETLLNILQVESGFEKKYNGAMGCRELDSIEKDDGILSQKLHEEALFKLTTLVSESCHGHSTAESTDAKEAILLGFDHHGRGWVEDISSMSSMKIQQDKQLTLKLLQVVTKSNIIFGSFI